MVDQYEMSESLHSETDMLDNKSIEVSTILAKLVLHIA